MPPEQFSDRAVNEQWEGPGVRHNVASLLRALGASYGARRSQGDVRPAGRGANGAGCGGSRLPYISTIRLKTLAGHFFAEIRPAFDRYVPHEAGCVAADSVAHAACRGVLAAPLLLRLPGPIVMGYT
jgi:hypothetical protein